jgi:hypothetical protein
VSIMTPGQDFIEPDTVLKCGALQIKLPATSKVIFSTVHCSVGRQLVRTLGLNCALKRSK